MQQQSGVVPAGGMFVTHSMSRPELNAQRVCVSEFADRGGTLMGWVRGWQGGGDVWIPASKLERCDDAAAPPPAAPAAAAAPAPPAAAPAAHPLHQQRAPPRPFSTPAQCPFTHLPYVNIEQLKQRAPAYASITCPDLLCYMIRYVDKISSRGQRQRRVLIITYKRVILVDDAGAIKRYIRTDQIKKVMRGAVSIGGRPVWQFLLQVPQEYDLLFELCDDQRDSESKGGDTHATMMARTFDQLRRAQPQPTADMEANPAEPIRWRGCCTVSKEGARSPSYSLLFNEVGRLHKEDAMRKRQYKPPSSQLAHLDQSERKGASPRSQFRDNTRAGQLSPRARTAMFGADPDDSQQFQSQTAPPPPAVPPPPAEPAPQPPVEATPPPAAEAVPPPPPEEPLQPQAAEVPPPAVPPPTMVSEEPPPQRATEKVVVDEEPPAQPPAAEAGQDAAPPPAGGGAAEEGAPAAKEPAALPPPPSTAPPSRHPTSGEQRGGEEEPPRARPETGDPKTTPPVEPLSRCGGEPAAAQRTVSCGVQTADLALPDGAPPSAVGRGSVAVQHHVAEPMSPATSGRPESPVLGVVGPGGVELHHGWDSIWIRYDPPPATSPSFPPQPREAPSALSPAHPPPPSPPPEAAPQQQAPQSAPPDPAPAAPEEPTPPAPAPAPPRPAEPAPAPVADKNAPPPRDEELDQIRERMDAVERELRATQQHARQTEERARRAEEELISLRQASPSFSPQRAAAAQSPASRAAIAAAPGELSPPRPCDGGAAAWDPHSGAPPPTPPPTWCFYEQPNPDAAQQDACPVVYKKRLIEIAETHEAGARHAWFCVSSKRQQRGGAADRTHLSRVTLVAPEERAAGAEPGATTLAALGLTFSVHCLHQPPSRFVCATHEEREAWVRWLSSALPRAAAPPQCSAVTA